MQMQFWIVGACAVARPHSCFRTGTWYDKANQRSGAIGAGRDTLTLGEAYKF